MARHADKYLPAPWQPEVKLGAITRERDEARMVGLGWIHAFSFFAAGLHSATVGAVADGLDSQTRRCARSVLDLLCFMWGMLNSHPAIWTWDHLHHVLALRDGPNASTRASRIIPMEMFMLNHTRSRLLMPSAERPAFNFTYDHEPDAHDPLAPAAPHHLQLTVDELELFRGPLLEDSPARRALLGHVREPSWLLLSAGVVMRSHACCQDGSAFMTFSQACAAVPRLRMLRGVQRDRAKRAWQLLLRDLELLQVDPVPGEEVVSAWDIWRDGSVADGSQEDGGGFAGSRDDIDSLTELLAKGTPTAIGEWHAAYARWAGGRCSAPRASRDMASPSAEEVQGPHTRYYLPGPERSVEVVTRGRPPPLPLPLDGAALARYARQRWSISSDGRSMTCSRGSCAADASVIVQLYLRALPIAIKAYDGELEQRACKRAKYECAMRRQGKDPNPPPPPTAEELSWAGGPGFNVSLANHTLQCQLRAEQSQGFTFTAAAVGDGSWHPQKDQVSRAALLHDGTVLGGALSTTDIVGGNRNNFDGELAHRVDVLHHLHGARLFYVFDSTSPVLAGLSFRYSTTSKRARAQCDDWQGSAMAFEQRQEAIVYWWSKSHIGHLPEAAVDALAKQYLEGDPLPPPVARSRHVSAHFYAKGSERDLMLHAINLHVVVHELDVGGDVRARGERCDALRVTKLCERDCHDVLRVRGDHFPLQASKAFPDAGPLSAGRMLRDNGCPCGLGPQSREHVLWRCQLREVRDIRRARLAPAVWGLALSLGNEQAITGDHAECSACVEAVREAAPPAAFSVLDGTSPQRFDERAARAACLALLLGVVRADAASRSHRVALKPMRSVMLSTVAMMRAAVRASRSHTNAAMANSLRLKRLWRAFQFLRMDTWLHPKPAGEVCSCCRDGVHRHRDDDSRSMSSCRPLTARAARWAAMQGDSQRAGVAAITTKLRVRARQQEAEAGRQWQLADSAGQESRRRIRRAVEDSPHLSYLSMESREGALGLAVECGEAAICERRAASTRALIVTWPRFANACIQRHARGARARAKADARAAKVREEERVKRAAAVRAEEQAARTLRERIARDVQHTGGVLRRSAAAIAEWRAGRIRKACAARDRAHAILDRVAASQTAYWRSPQRMVEWASEWRGEREAREAGDPTGGSATRRTVVVATVISPAAMPSTLLG